MFGWGIGLAYRCRNTVGGVQRRAIEREVERERDRMYDEPSATITTTDEERARFA
jgi:hypothetical protein